MLVQSTVSRRTTEAAQSDREPRRRHRNAPSRMMCENWPDCSAASGASLADRRVNGLGFLMEEKGAAL